MNDLNNAYAEIAHGTNDIKERIIKSLRDNFAIIILIFNILLRIVLELFDANVGNPFNADFFIKLGVDIATTMFCYCCFISYGMKSEKQVMTGYNNNRILWATLSESVRKDKSEEFSDFCRRCADEEREERRRAIILNNTMISWPCFNEKWRGLTEKEVEKRVENGEISETDARYINKANGIIKVKPINPLLILCGVKISSLNDAGRDGMRPSTLAALSRPFSMFVLSACFGMLHGTWRGISTGEEIYKMILSVLMIVLSSVMGYYAGVNAAQKEHDKIKSRIFFIEKFNQKPNT